MKAELVGANPQAANNSLYFDFVEAAVPADEVRQQVVRRNETLATDWDTDHSVALPAERVAWAMDMLGFRGRANHYVGAILFYEMTNPGAAFAAASVIFEGTPVFSQAVGISIDGTPFERLTLSADSNDSIATHFEYLINNGSTGVWAAADGNQLTIRSRLLGLRGNAITLSAWPETGPFQAVVSAANLAGGKDGAWITDMIAEPRTNRAARDWHRAFYAALKQRGIEVTAAYSTELSHGDPSAAAGIAQRHPDGSPVLLNTPAVQTNFSPVSIQYWRDVYLEMAALQVQAGVMPYLQFGEIQW